MLECVVDFHSHWERPFLLLLLSECVSVEVEWVSVAT